MKFVIPGLTGIQSKPTMACFERHRIPAFAGMTFVPSARWIDNVEMTGAEQLLRRAWLTQS